MGFKNKNYFWIILEFLVIIFLVFYILKVGGIKLNNNYSNTKTSTKKTTNITTSSTTSTTNVSQNIDGNEQELKYVDGILIVNKTYPLPKDYVPKNTYKDAEGLKYCTECIDKEAYEQFGLMKSDATALGLNIWIQSGYRSYELQSELYNKYVNLDGQDVTDTYSARPGYSEHQTGLAIDLNTITEDFQYTNEGIWVNENAWKYGFILRYPKGKENITGYKYEPWHLRYVGANLAQELYNNGDWITLEEHFNLTSNYKN